MRAALLVAKPLPGDASLTAHGIVRVIALTSLSLASDQSHQFPCLQQQCLLSPGAEADVEAASLEGSRAADVTVIAVCLHHTT